MKKRLIIGLSAFAAVFSGCKKQDTTAPVITISSGSSITISLPAIAGGNSWSAPSVSATDDQDGDLSSAITSTADPDVNTKGTYTVTYSVNDNSGNQAQAFLTVHVVNDAETFAGNYLVHDSVPTLPALDYSMNISTDNFINNHIHFNSGTHNSTTVGFACYQNNYTIYGVVAGAGVTIPSQTAGPIGTDNSTHDFLGSGPVTSSSPVMFNITYTDHDQTNSTTASGCVQNYVHQ